MDSSAVVSNARWVLFSTATIVCFAHASDEIIEDIFTLEKMFRDLHPNLKNLTWSLVGRLTSEIHETLCREVLAQITPPGQSVDKHKYVVPEARTIKKSRVFRRVPLYFQGTGVEYTPVVMCTYEDMKVYLVHGDDKRVFVLNRDQDNIFTFKSGLHPVSVDVS